MRDRLRISSFILALCVFCCIFAGCDIFDASAPSGLSSGSGLFKQVEQMNFLYSPYYSPTVSRYSYDCLDEKEKQLYDQILDGIGSVSAERSSDLGLYPMKTVRLQGSLSIARMRVAIRALSNDNPYYFWLSQSFSHLSAGDGSYTEVVPYSEFDPDTLRGMRERIDAILGDFYASVPDGLSAYEREKLVHDYLIDNCEYGYDIAAMTDSGGDKVRGHSVYGALANHRCVCEGYGMAMQLLLNGLGVDCVTLTGMSYNGSLDRGGADPELHLWNAVRLDGDWYHVDPTWDDQAQQVQRYVYFNLTDDQIRADHTLSGTIDTVDEKRIAEQGTEDLNLYVPTCDAAVYNYYIYECPHLTQYEGGAVRQGLLDAALSREAIYTFYIDPEYLDFDTAVRLLFSDAPQYFFGYVSDVNEQLYDYEIDDGNITYYPYDERCSVSVELRYY